MNESGQLEGYFDESCYPSIFNVVFSPASLAGALAWSGFQPPAMRQPFKLLDLGCGDGISLCIIAAAHPEGEFVGVDAMPEHIESAISFAAKYNINNIEFIQQTFDKYNNSDDDLFHFITSQGVIAWVSEANRQCVYNIVAKRLSEGGVFAVGYNSMPGWQNRLTFQRLLRQIVIQEGSSSKQAFKYALQTIQSFANAGAVSLDAKVVEQFIDIQANVPFAYLQHEYLNQYWQPLWFDEVNSALSQRGLDFASEARFGRLRDDFFLRRSQRDSIALISDPTLRQTYIDIACNQQFRVDIFAKSIQSAPLAKSQDGCWLMALNSLAESEFSCQTAAGTLRFDNQATRNVLTILASNPLTFENLVEHCAATRYSLSAADVHNAVETLLTAGSVQVVAAPLTDNPAPKLNQHLLKQRSNNNSATLKALVSRYGAINTHCGDLKTSIKESTAGNENLVRLGI